jgi:hypothetical protein
LLMSVNRMDQVENRISAIKHKLEEVHQCDKDKEKILRKHERNMQDHWDTIKRSNL